MTPARERPLLEASRSIFFFSGSFVSTQNSRVFDNVSYAADAKPTGFEVIFCEMSEAARTNFLATTW